jgi:hypothetical protein
MAKKILIQSTWCPNKMIQSGIYKDKIIIFCDRANGGLRVRG